MFLAPALVLFLVFPIVAYSQDYAEVRTAKILDFKQIQGDPSWRDSQLRRISGAVWTFYGNGTMTFNMPDTRDDLYPIRGTFRSDGTNLDFSGRSVFRNTAGTSEVNITGKLFPSQGGKLISMKIRSAMYLGATVNNQKFSGQNHSEYMFTVLIQ